MAVKQLFGARLHGISVGSTVYLAGNLAPYTFSGVLVSPTWLVGGTFRNAKVNLTVAPGTGNSFTFTLVKNGVDTALVLTISNAATSATNTSDTVSVVNGDEVHWKCVPSGTPVTSLPRFSVEFWGTTTGESGYASIIGVTGSQTWRGPIFSAGQWNIGNAGSSNFEVVAAAGNLTALNFNLDSAPGGTTSLTFTVFKNGVAQDGTGGTVNTVTTITGAATTGSWTGTLALTAGDYVYIEVVPTGTTPASTMCGFSAKFVSTIDGESQLCALWFDDLPTSGGAYYTHPHYASSGTWDLTETDVDANGPASSDFGIRNMRVRAGIAIATGPVTFALRVNGGGAGPMVTLSGTEQVGSDLTNIGYLVPGDTWDWQYSLVATPGSGRIVCVSAVLYALTSPPPVSSSFVLGKGGIVAGVSRAFCVSLDGNTNTLSEAGKMKVFGNFDTKGYFELQPITAPAAPASGVRIYLDTADGDLKAKHANGTTNTLSSN